MFYIVYVTIIIISVIIIIIIIITTRHVVIGDAHKQFTGTAVWKYLSLNRILHIRIEDNRLKEYCEN